MTCRELSDEAAELAFGALTGRERALALAHLEACRACLEVVRRLMTTADELLGLLPVHDPPPGFEVAVLARIGLPAPCPGPAPSGRPARARFLLAVLSVLAAVSAGAAGWSLRPATPSAVSPLAAAALMSPSHRLVGQAFAYRAGAGWIYVSVDLGAGSQVITCQIVGLGGQVASVGTFWVTDGRGAWGGPDPAGPGWPGSVRLVAAGGAIVAVASFAPAR
jgi:hypothetical protein